MTSLAACIARSNYAHFFGLYRAAHGKAPRIHALRERISSPEGLRRAWLTLERWGAVEAGQITEHGRALLAELGKKWAEDEQ